MIFKGTIYVEQTIEKTVILKAPWLEYINTYKC